MVEETRKWYIINTPEYSDSTSILRFASKDGQYDWQATDTADLTPVFFMENGMPKIRFVAGNFQRPVKSPHKVNQSYNDEYWSKKRQTYVRHTGVDYRRIDELARATSHGRVIRKQTNGEGCVKCIGEAGCGCKDLGLGNSIIIEHILSSGSKIYSLYAHLSSFSEKISEGVCVSPGSELGRIGGTGYGSSTTYAPHLHFEIKSANTLADPVSGIHVGYTPTNPDNYGFTDPYSFIVSPANQIAEPCTDGGR